MTTDSTSQGIDWNAIPKERRKEIIGSLFIDHHDVLSSITKEIDKARLARRYLPEPTCILITGGTGTGKTFFLRHYVKANSTKRVDGRTNRPVLLAEMRVRSTLSAAATEILNALGDPGAKRGNKDDKTFRILTLLKQSCTEAILIDEFQHIVEANKDLTLNSVGDWLKQLAKSSNTPLVIAGMPNSTAIIEKNEQFRAIVSKVYELENFKFGTISERLKFCELLIKIDSKLPFNNLSMLGSQEIASRIFEATNGNMRQVFKTIYHAAFDAIDNESSFISLENLENNFNTIQHKSKLTPDPKTGGINK